jgi:hypothetical protein
VQKIAHMEAVTASPDWDDRYRDAASLDGAGNAN